MSSNAIESANRQSAESLSKLEGKTSKIDELTAVLSTNSLKKQLQTIHVLTTLGEAGEAVLVAFVRDRMLATNPDEPTAAHGRAYQFLYSRTSEAAKDLIAEFPEGLVCPQSDKNIDYSDLQMLLVQQNYEQADKLTNQKLCELAGKSAVERKWVYFTEVDQIPVIDLQAIDLMWSLYSEGKFGWRQQKELWTRLGNDWERLWIQLLWKSAGGAWTRYPGEFVWDLAAAPPAHLPLSNQLRGVRTMSALLSHPAWH